MQATCVQNDQETVNLHFNNDEAKETPFRWFENNVIGSKSEGGNKASNFSTDIT